MYLISVIVPVFNSGRYLERCIDSILKQNISDIEIIIVNDGSTDDYTIQLCREFNLTYENITLIEQSNLGSASARNAGINIANGQYIGFVDSDDSIKGFMYSKLYNAIKVNNTKISFCDLSILNENKDISQQININSGVYNQTDALHFFLLGNWHSACTALYSREILQDKKFPDGEINEDYIFNFNILMEINKISFVNEKLYSYIKRGDSNTGLEANTRHLDWINNTIKVKNIIEKNIHLKEKLSSQAKYQYLFANIVLGNKIIISNLNGANNERNKMYKNISLDLKKNIIDIVLNKHLSLRKKIMGILLSLTPNLYKVIVKKLLEMKRPDRKREVF